MRVHPGRRQRPDRLASVPAVRIAMVCLGNICRSPMAAVVANAMISGAGLAEEITVESFGTAGYHTGERADPQAEAALRRRGWTAGHHRARQLQAGDVADADLVLCADRANIASVRRLARPADDTKIRLLADYGPGGEVPDPWGGADADFDRSLGIVEQSCRGLVDDLVAARR